MISAYDEDLLSFHRFLLHIRKLIIRARQSMTGPEIRVAPAIGMFLRQSRYATLEAWYDN
uniref:Uncharacterized protein n=1 Tax=Romanomermis culicivorax TaxID=13658 RepID=A0A915L5Z0_ROMCU